MGNGDFEVGILDDQFHFAKPDELSGGQSGFPDRPSIDERPVGGLQIAEGDAILGEHDFTVKVGYGRMRDGEIDVRAAPDAVGPQFQFNRAVLNSGRLD